MLAKSLPPQGAANALLDTVLDRVILSQSLAQNHNGSVSAGLKGSAAPEAPLADQVKMISRNPDCPVAQPDLSFMARNASG